MSMMDPRVMALIAETVKDMQKGLITSEECSNKILLLNHIYNGWKDDSKRDGKENEEKRDGA